jgi:methionyl-tRNA synthetase
MLPSKGRRNIVIDGITWHYLPSGGYVLAHNPETGEQIKWATHYDDVQITPSLVEEIIRTKGKPEGFNLPKPKKYITTTLPYANSVPHIGHAFEFIIGDSLARYFRGKLGDTNVHFNIGLDEHGKKIWDASVATGKPVKQYLDELNGEWRNFCSLFDIQCNSFYRTSHSGHYEKVAKFWTECKNKGLIYKKTYQGNYCVGCESFKLEKDLVDGKCPDHPNLETQFVAEENYFFALTKFRKELLEWFEKDCYLRPYSKRDELKNVIDDIQDISISRKRESVPWGIPVPGDSTQTIYVWFEALLNYILIAGYYGDRNEFDSYWNESVQIFGPDNLKFQSAIFQGLLSAADVKHTKTLLCHGTILDKEGKKMSKTVGNVIDPIDQLNKYGVDAVRYYALAGLQVYGNSVWDESQLVNLHNAHLADNYGNLLTRVVHLINLQGEKWTYRSYQNHEFHSLFKIHFDTVKELWDHYDITAALHKLNDTIKVANQYITEKQPWSKDCQETEKVLATLYWVLQEATLLYLPVIPHKGKQALDSLQSLRKEIVFPKIELAKSETISA